MSRRNPEARARRCIGPGVSHGAKRQWRCVLGQWMSWAEVVNESRAVVINACGSFDRLCCRGVFSSIDRSESDIGCLRHELGSLDRLCWRGGWGWACGWPSLGCWLGLSSARSVKLLDCSGWAEPYLGGGGLGRLDK